MTTLVRKFTPPGGFFLDGTKPTADHKPRQQEQKADSKVFRTEPLARVITPPISSAPTDTVAAIGGTATKPGAQVDGRFTSGGLALLSTAAENQSVEDIIDESLKDFDLAVCTKNLQSFKTV
eukprot:CAMPEP_0178511134 /NCGR_PEP_ID=MMETSP0696-20121128/22208_1 /TAXON_ID=265572 /ORGANISM="Extubocellulus spinifer, Strain CCMP396" /LENGTH=121 /DNA_ID=CAMNT_0020140903 /DNA_START=120 /DNA_END=485 /DNA_ORIENTATION=+